MSERQFKVWKTIRIGGMSRAELLRELERIEAFSCEGSARNARRMIQHDDFEIAAEPRTLRLVKTSFMELGKASSRVSPHSVRRIWDSAAEVGLDLCPAETGPQLRLQYPAPEQPEQEKLYIAMRQITLEIGYPLVFSVSKAGRPAYLTDCQAHPDFQEFFADSVWIFALPEHNAR